MTKKRINFVIDSILADELDSTIRRLMANKDINISRSEVICHLITLFVEENKKGSEDGEETNQD